jgi:hypothetical protein
VSEPAAPQPEPEPEKYEWREPRDRDVDVLALVVCRVLSDYDAAVNLIETLDHWQLVSVLWCICRWYGGALAENFEDPVEMLRGLALILARGRGEAA